LSISWRSSLQLFSHFGFLFSQAIGSLPISWRIKKLRNYTLKKYRKRSRGVTPLLLVFGVWA
jgi:hypothetical protein